MIFKDEYDVSLWPKCVFMAAISATILVSGYLMLANAERTFSWVGPYEIRGDFVRRIILMACLVIYYIRLLMTVFVSLKRRMVWTETIVISFLMSLALYSFAKVGGSNQQPIGVIELVGVFLYIVGSYLNTHSEYTRYAWKKNPDNKGRLYTEGLFKYSMHVNYFGDAVLFTGFALITHSIIMLIIPFLVTANFALFIIPSLDKYLGKKYGREFKEYAERTKKFIPMVY